MADVQLEGVTRSFGDTVAVSDLSLDIRDGEFVVLLGPTGAGKTTTLRLVAGLERPDAGRILIGGRDVTTVSPAERDVALVFQQYSLYPHLSVYDNLAFPLRAPIRRVPPDAIDRKVREVARMLQIDSKLNNRATQLSGGQMQRVAIGRALVRSPSIHLMDEPLSSLDAKLRAELRLELQRIQRELGATILYVTHDQTEAMTLASRIGVIDRGRLVQIGTPRQIYEDPDSTYVATRLGQPGINLLPPALFNDAPMPDGTATVAARTEHLRITRAGDGHAMGKVRWIERLGDQNHLHIDLAQVHGKQYQVVTLVEPDTGIDVGDPVDLTLAGALFFDAQGNRIRTAGTGGSIA
jgi:multiple sugar transport system ATP-binding protein